MTTVISSLLKAHITRFNGSMGSGTDLGRTTVSATGGFVKPTAGSCPWANGERHNNRTTSATSTELRILQPGWIFKSLAFLFLRWKSFGLGRSTQAALRILADNPVPRLWG